MSSGCLVTEAVQFQAPSGTPPAITGATTDDGHPLDRIILVQTDELRGGDGGPPNPVRIAVTVWDADVDQELAYKVYVDYNPVLPRAADVSDFLAPVTSTADRTRRPLEFIVPSAPLLAVGCHRVELRVSGGFRPDRPDPVREGDLAAAVWWVATRDDMSTTIDIVGCP